MVTVPDLEPDVGDFVVQLDVSGIDEYLLSLPKKLGIFNSWGIKKRGVNPVRLWFFHVYAWVMV